MDLLAELARTAKTPSDNNEHLLTIRDLVVETNAQKALELGVGHGRITCAILAGLTVTGGKLTSVDNLEYAGTRAKFAADNWLYVTAHDMTWTPEFTEEVDVLVIDSSHEREHTLNELKKFGQLVSDTGVIILHDTVSFPGVKTAIQEFLENEPWDAEYFDNNNGLAVLRRGEARQAAPVNIVAQGDLDSTSGPTVLMGAFKDALAKDPRYSITGSPNPDSKVVWIPLYSHLQVLVDAIRAGRSIALGPNVVFANSQSPGAGAHEREICDYEGYKAIFWLSRWYAELGRKHFKQQTNHYILDIPMPGPWKMLKHYAEIDCDAMIYVKGGKQEKAIADRLCEIFPKHIKITYGGYTREALLEAARRSRACFYVSREDNYPLAAMEIGLMGCPIISDEKSCPVLIHGLTGITVPVRERGINEGLVWGDKAADDLAANWKGCLAIDRSQIRGTVIRRHSPKMTVERISGALGV